MSNTKRRSPLVFRMLLALVIIGAIVGVWRYLDQPARSLNSPSIIKYK